MLLQDLQAASFRGAPFLVPSDDTEEGRNSIVHDYPDQAMRYVEDNGKIPPCFQIRAILHGQGLPGKLNRLRSALNRPGPGVLKHPVFGTQFVAVDKTYRIKREDKQSGVIELDIKFIVTGPPALPGLVSGVAALVTGLASAAITAAFASFVSSFKVPRTVTSATTLAESLKDVVLDLDARIGQATSAPGRLYDRAQVYVRNPSSMESLLAESFLKPFEDETLSNRHLVDAFAAVATTARYASADADLISPTTLDLADRKISQGAIGDYLQFAAFCALADSMAGRAYATGEEVDEDEQRLTSTYEAVQERGLPSEQHAAMADIYTATSEVLSQASVRLPRLVDIDAVSTPASVLAYELYETDGLNHSDIPDRIQQIIDLNLNQDPCVLGPETTVLTRLN